MDQRAHQYTFQEVSHLIDKMDHLPIFMEDHHLMVWGVVNHHIHTQCNIDMGLDKIIATSYMLVL
jgi:hypothetical protein